MSLKILKAYTLYTPQYQSIHDTFLRPSIPQDINFSSVLLNKKIEYDKYDSNSLGGGDFWKVAKSKLQYLRNIVQQSLNTHILWVDVDIIFTINKIIDELKPYFEYDMACQMDNNKPCSGFMLIKCTPKIVSFFNKAIQIAPTQNSCLHDQAAIQRLWKNINGVLLPKTKFYDMEYTRLDDSKLYIKNLYTNDKFYLPKDMIMFHANYACKTLNDKANYLQLIKNIYIHPISYKGV